MTTGTAIITSNGQACARGCAVVAVRQAAPEPPIVTERVIIVPPTQTVTRTGALVGSGPRAPQHAAWPPPKAAAIVMPDGRPLTKAQRFWIDPELLARWDAEAERMRSE